MAGESAREVARRAREKAERLNRHAELYERGAEGEEMTATALSALPLGWFVLHDVKWPGRRFANIDHILIGPAGIFVIDSKNWTGNISITGGHLRQNGRSREKFVAGSADSALAVAELTGPLARIVVPVLCFVGDSRHLTGWCRDVMISSVDNLTQMLLSRPTVLTPEQVVDGWSRLDAQLCSATAPVAPSAPQRSYSPPVSHPSAPERLPLAKAPKSASRGRRSVKSSRVVRSLLGLVMLAVFASFAPQIITAFGNAVANQLTPRSGCAAGPGSTGSTRPTESARSARSTTKATGKNEQKNAAAADADAETKSSKSDAAGARKQKRVQTEVAADC